MKKLLLVLLLFGFSAYAGTTKHLPVDETDLLKVAAGEIEGQKAVNKFGRAQDLI